MTDKRRVIGLIIVLICVSSNVYSADKIYKTNFSLTENTLHEDVGEGPMWTNGKSTGVDWSDVKTSNGNATGTQIWDGAYRDSAAILKGTWQADQSSSAIVHVANQDECPTCTSGWYGNDLDPTGCNKEVELLLRGTITPHSIRTYEVFWSSRIDGTSYLDIGRWDGAEGVFPGYIYQSGPGWGNGAADGDTVAATISGYPPTIRAYKNGVLQAEVTDPYPDPIATGNPGVGFWSTRGCTGTAHDDDFGFTSFTATAAETIVPNPQSKVPNSPAKITISP